MALSSRVSPAVKHSMRDLWNRCRFRGAALGRGTYVQNRVSIAKKTIIGEHCALMRGATLLPDVRLGAHVVIGRDARVGRARIGDHNTIETDAELYQAMLADHVQVQTRSILTEVEVGRYTYIGRESYLNLVTVGAFSSIGPQVLAGLGEHPTDLGTTSPAFYSTRRQCGETFAVRDQFTERRPIMIGNDVWIGARVFIRDGVHIGDGAIIAAGAVVVRDVAPYSIVGGAPAHLIRTRFSEAEISRLLSLKWWHWGDERLRRAQPYLAARDVGAFLDWAESDESTAPLVAH